METSKFLINNYITSINIQNSNDKMELLKTNLFKMGILLKDYPDDNLILLYNKYDSKNKCPIELECRSVFLNRDTFEIVCYTCPTPIYNIDAMNYLVKNKVKEEDKQIFKCYEGTLLSLFYYNDKWYLSSRKCLDTKDSLVLDKSKSRYDMFMEVIQQDNYNTSEDFTKLLDTSFTYHFVLIHHQNENIVNYLVEFGKEYKKLCFIFSRSVETHQEINSEDIDSLFLSDNIFLPKKLIDETTFDKNNQLSEFTKKPIEEGIIIKTNNMILKFQTTSYQFYKVCGSTNNLYRGFIKLYQTNKLKEYFNNYKESYKYQKIVNPLNISESFDTIGIIDAIFKVCTSELYHLFNSLWNKEEEHINEELYKILPKEYKNILFQLRGLYFKNKLKFKNNSNEYLKLNNVYIHLKSLETKNIENFLKERKLLLNWTRIDSENKVLKIFTKTLYKNIKVLYKLTAIYSNKLFPEIMPDDLPKIVV